MLPVICIGAIDFIAGVGGDSGLIVIFVRSAFSVQEYQCCLRGPAVGSVTVILVGVVMPQPLGVVLL